MNLYQPTITGSLSVSGSINISGSINVVGGGGTITGTASYATNADLLDGLDSTVFTLTSSFAAQTASFTAFTSSVNTFTASINSFSASVLSYTSSLNAKTSSFATTGSNTFEGIQTINSNLIVTGSITAQTLVVQTITSSVDFVTGSTRFGSLLANSHVFTGSLSVTGSTHSIFGNVVLGNTSSVNASARLEVKGDLFLTPSSSASSIIHLYNRDSTNETYIYDSGSSTNSLLILSPGGINKALVVSSSGFVGIGTTTPTSLLEVSLSQNTQTGIRLRNSTSGTGASVEFGAYTNSGNGGFGKYSTTTTAYKNIVAASTYIYNGSSGDIGLLNDASSGNISFAAGGSSTAQMFISASGNVGIGTLTPIQKLDVSGRGHFSGVDTPYIDFKSTDTTGVGWQFKQISFKDATNAELYAIGYHYPNLKLEVSGTRVMTLTNTGHTGVGVIPSAWASGTTALQIGTTNALWNRASDGLTVLASNSYFDGSSDKQITTNTSNRIYFVNGGTYFERAASTSAGSNTPWVSSMVISANGNIGAPSAGTNIYNASDLRLKSNIATITDGLNKVMGLNPVKFNWIHDFEPTENDKNLLGFIAQEVQTVIPEAVENFSSNLITVGETTIENPLRVNEKFIIPVLVKAIQELKAEFDAYKATHP